MLTYLEFNGWLWELPDGFRVLVDPILVGNLNFGIPWLFDATKKSLPKSQPNAGVLTSVDLLLITQSLDDHCHLHTLTQLAAIRPGLPIIATPNARAILSALPFTHVTYLEPGQSTTAAAVTVLATAGPVLGPPWQRPENGYIVTTAAAGKTEIERAEDAGGRGRGSRGAVARYLPMDRSPGSLRAAGLAAPGRAGGSEALLGGGAAGDSAGWWWRRSSGGGELRSYGTPARDDRGGSAYFGP
ncbi:uncharacterized protein LOC119334141 [Triticum dicoccoides]|uniref:uncharacterized protein LOC119334141 n=1 Tax=Triticum dicoccoides TaxID=85692 RepID=UPI001891119E|nr:uncharacterized protein LOC119334141 [Triticum dicoccoides]